MRSHLLGIALFVALVSPLSAATPAVFENPRSILMAHGAAGIEVADFDRDQKLDFAVVAVTGGNTIRILVHRGNGDGSFRDPVGSTFVHSAAISGIASAAGDIDGNGVQDFVVFTRSQNSSLIQSFVGKGDGTFEAGSPTATDGFHCADSRFVLADMTGDGRADIVNCGVGVMPSLGNGSFAAVIRSPALKPGRVLVLDANGDGKRDVFVFGFETVLMAGNGDGTLQPPTVIEDSQASTGIAADFDGNGYADVTFIDEIRRDRVTVLASATGQYTTRSKGFDADFSAAEMLTPDMNGDSRPDLVAGAAGHLYIWLTQPGGLSAKPRIFLSGNNTDRIASGDFDSDGKIDLLAVGDYDWSSDGTYVAVLRGAGDGTLHAERGYASPQYFDGRFHTQGFSGIDLTDITGDGLVDVVAVAGLEFNVLPGVGGGTFGEAIVTQHSSGSRPSFGDLNGDGVVDVMLTSANLFQLWMGNRNGTFRPGQSIHPSGPSSFRKATLGDFNGDGHLDFTELRTNTAHFRPGLGNGTFGAEVVTTTSLFLYGTNVDRAGDVNGDRRDDIVTHNAVLLGLPNGQFTPLLYSAPDSDRVLADLDDDGDLDAISIDKSWSWGEVHVQLGRGDGTFGYRRNLQVLIYAGDGPPTAADFNNDGNVDISFGTSVLLGDGTGWFDGYARFRGSDQQSAAAAADVDGNGSADLVVAGQSGYGLDVIRTMRTTSRELLRPITAGAAMSSASLGNSFSMVVLETTPLDPGSGAVLFHLYGKLGSVGELVDGRAQGTLQTLLGGKHPYTAIYGGDEVYARGTTPLTGEINVQRIPTTLTATASPSSPRASDSVRIRGSFTRFGDLDPTGVVTVVVDNVLRGTGSAPHLDVDIGQLTEGAHRVLLQYKGDSNYLEASRIFDFTVGKPAVNMVLSISPAGSALPGMPVTFTASFPNDPALTGEVVFTVDSQTVAQQPITAGAASFTTTLALGSHKIRAAFAGNAQYSSTESEVLYTITQGQPRRRAVRSP